MATLARKDVNGMPTQPWRQSLRIASFRGATFHVENNSLEAGRRVALHEYPKRNTPYAEDMGHRAFQHHVVGYIISSARVPDYRQQRDRLKEALDGDGASRLVTPTLGEMTVMCVSYNCNESRQRGGFCIFDMRFVEAGSPGDSVIYVATQALSVAAATAVDQAARQALDRAIADQSRVNQPFTGSAAP